MTGSYRQGLLRGAVLGLLLVGGAAGSAAALEPLLTYEDWTTSATIRGDRWRGGATPAQDVQKEQQGRHKVQMRLRREGGTGSNTGFVGAGLDLAMTHPLAVDQIEATFKIKSARLQGCPGVTFPSSNALPAQLSLNKLYDGTPRLAGQMTGDHFARVRAFRPVWSTDPDGALRIQAAVFRCVDAVCSNAASIPGFVELADLVYVGDPFTLRLAWDPANHRFLAGLNAGPDVALPYPATLTPNPGGPFSSISMIAAAANCEAAAGISDAEIEVREVRTNASAVIP